MKEQPRTQLWITKGATITSEGREYVILAVADINMVLAQDLESGDKALLKIGELGPPKVIGEINPPPPGESELTDVPESLWAVAETRRRLIDPLLNSYSTHSEALAKKIAIEAHVSRATVYRWVAAFRRTALLAACTLEFCIRIQSILRQRGQKQFAE
jgi:putative transposase